MSKLKNMAVFSAMLVGVMIYTSPAKSAVCFLPDDDGSCGGGDIEISDDSTSENQCADFTLSQNQRNSKEYDSDCYSCEPCTYNSRTTYKCALNSGATWYGGNLSVCCTNGEKYDSAEGKCCPAGGCEHNCPEGQSWDSSAKSCKCDNGKDANGGICCADSEHVSDGICCPEKKHNENGECVCDSKYNTDKDGNCVLQNEQKITIVIYYKMDMSRQDSSSWLNLTFKVLSASDAKSHHVELTFNPMDGAEPTNCTISYPLTFGTNTKTKVQCGSVYSMMNTPELTNVSVDNNNVAASVRLNQLDNSTVQNDKYIIKFTRNYNQTCDIIKNEYYSKDDCETDHPDTICNQNMSTKCWIGKCDTRSNTNYYETESACYDSYQDECYDCNLKPCEQVDEDTNCWFINCSKIGMYDRENECKENSSSGKCTFDNGLGCYNPVNEPICDKNESLYASEEECEKWSDLLEGDRDECTKVGNCYKPASFVVSVSFDQPHCGYNPYLGYDCDWYGKTFLFKEGSFGESAFDNSDYPTYRQLYAGKYTIRTEGQSTERKSGVGKFCRTSYVNKIELLGSDGTDINFDALSHGDEQDIARGDYPMTTATQKTFILGRTNGGCIVKSNYYEFTMGYTFKPGVVYDLVLYDYIKNCEVPCY